MNTPSDTIAAIATSLGEAAIAIVRISGPRAHHIGDQLLPRLRPSQHPGGSFLHGFLSVGTDPALGTDPAPLDEVIALVFRAPRSYTREDVLEIQCHGGAQSARRILKVALSLGARLANAGEFTLRAFLNGRIDLLQAEAVASLIRARSDASAAQACLDLGGYLSRSCAKLYSETADVLSEVEARLDFGEEGVPDLDLACLHRSIGRLAQEGSSLVESESRALLLREGALVAIVGKPNTGKSTLFNLLVGSERAIVSPTPGTTRDCLEECVLIDGVPLRILDTAGLREPECDVERESIARAERGRAAADAVIHVFDGSLETREGIAEAGDDAGDLSSAQELVVLNKSDLGLGLAGNELEGRTVIETSLITGSGLDAIRDWLAGVVERVGAGQRGATRDRRMGHLMSFAESLSQARAATALEDCDLALCAAGLRGALDELGCLTGRTWAPDVFEVIFSRFCIGK